MREGRILTEAQLRKRKRERALQPYKEGVATVARETGRVVLGMGKALIDGLNYLGKENKPRRSKLKRRIRAVKEERLWGKRRRY